MILGIGIPLLLIIISSYIIWKSTDSFEMAADYLGRNMSQGVKGATINAVASSMPEFLTTMFFLFYIQDEGNFSDSFSGGLGVTAGSAVFNLLIIPFSILFFGSIVNRNFKFPVNKKAVIRDGLFLILANAVLILIIRHQFLNIYHGLILIMVYLFYLFTLRKGFRCEGKQESAGEFKIPYQNIGFRQFIFLDIKQILLNGRQLNAALSWLTLVISTLIMSVGTWLLVEATEILGQESYSFMGIKNLHGLGVPIIFLSVIFAAAATSIPDTMISIRDAKKGNHDDSISNALGSNIFDISFAIGLPLFIYTVLSGPIEMSLEVRKWSLSIWVALFCINLVVLPLMMASKKINKRKGLVLFVLYVLFIVYIVEENTLAASWISNLLERFLL